MIGTQEDIFAEQKHSKVLDGANHCVEFDVIRSIVAFRAGEGSREEAHCVVEARIVEALFEDCSFCNATAVSLEDEGALEIR